MNATFKGIEPRDALREAARRLPDHADMVEHNPDEGTRYFCCGQPVAFDPFPRAMREHATDCWYVAIRALLNSEGKS